MDKIDRIILRAVTDMNNIRAVLPVVAGFILVAISMALTLIAGLIPSRIAAKKDPVVHKQRGCRESDSLCFIWDAQASFLFSPGSAAHSGIGLGAEFRLRGEGSCSRYSDMPAGAFTAFVA